MLLERNGPGDAEQAHALLATAIAAYQSMGMPAFEALAQSMLT
jgi:hypothetical protein